MLTCFRAFAPGDAVPSSELFLSADGVEGRIRDATFACAAVLFRWSGDLRLLAASYPVIATPQATAYSLRICPTGRGMVVTCYTGARSLMAEAGGAEIAKALIDTPGWLYAPSGAKPILTDLRKALRATQPPSAADEALGQAILRTAGNRS